MVTKNVVSKISGFTTFGSPSPKIPIKLHGSLHGDGVEKLAAEHSTQLISVGTSMETFPCKLEQRSQTRFWCECLQELVHVHTCMSLHVKTAKQASAIARYGHSGTQSSPKEAH